MVLTRCDGDGFVLTDASGNEYDCETPQQLWDDLKAIHGDAEVPPLETEAATGTDGVTAQEVYDRAADELEALARDGYGPLAGRFTRHVVRNGGKTAHRFLRSISRKGKRRR